MRPIGRWIPSAAVAAVAGLMILSGILDVGGWRREFRDSRLAAAAVRSWTDEAFAAHRAGAHDAAAVLLRRAATLRPEDPRVHHRLGLVEKARGNRETARRALERAAAIDPSFRSALDAFDEGP